jgi:hypothetical protein
VGSPWVRGLMRCYRLISMYYAAPSTLTPTSNTSDVGSGQCRVSRSGLHLADDAGQDRHAKLESGTVADTAIGRRTGTLCVSLLYIIMLLMLLLSVVSLI